MKEKLNTLLSTSILLITVLIGTSAMNSASSVTQQKGKLAGVVIDANDARVKGASVTVQYDTEEWKAISGAAGDFEIELPVKPLPYHFTVKANGFCKFEGEQVKIQLRQTEMINIHLEVSTTHIGC